MEPYVMNDRIQLVDADITELEVDAIVNAANTSLLGGGGVDGAIHRAAGPGLLEECRKLNGCATGDAKITEGYNLPARYVIHTVGPVWHGGASGEEELLAGCYRKCFQLAREYDLQSMAFPAVSTGVYGFPKDRASRIAIRTTLEELAENKRLARVLFVCFNIETRNAYEKALGRI
jgi:O-acetyl-ADP-ribose deacetylase (regulator of RNase III)